MTKFLLSLLFFGFTLTAFAQKTSGCEGCGSNVNQYNNTSNINSLGKPEPKLSVYPNPASDYIEISNDETVGKVVVFNMIGREQKSFKASKGERYSIADLSNGMYLVKIISNENKLMTTQRLQKR